jgi:ribonuclease HI
MSVRTDGAARGNPGPASAGAVLIDLDRPDARNPRALPDATISEYLGVQTNNVAEYTAVVRALALAAELGAREVVMLLDSMLIVEQLTGRWRVRDAKLIPLWEAARRTLHGFERWSASHVPRAQNSLADALATRRSTASRPAARRSSSGDPTSSREPEGRGGRRAPCEPRSAAGRPRPRCPSRFSSRSSSAACDAAVPPPGRGLAGALGRGVRGAGLDGPSRSAGWRFPGHARPGQLHRRRRSTAPAVQLVRRPLPLRHGQRSHRVRRDGGDGAGLRRREPDGHRRRLLRRDQPGRPGLPRP